MCGCAIHSKLVLVFTSGTKKHNIHSAWNAKLGYKTWVGFWDTYSIANKGLTQNLFHYHSMSFFYPCFLFLKSSVPGRISTINSVIWSMCHTFNFLLLIYKSLLYHVTKPHVSIAKSQPADPNNPHYRKKSSWNSRVDWISCLIAILSGFQKYAAPLRYFFVFNMREYMYLNMP